MEVGQRLSEARRRRKLTVADIARTTKIPVRFLEAIDRDDVDHLPHGFFARAFVRTYAKEVGVNPGDVLDGVDEIVSAESEPEVPALPPVDAPVLLRSLLFIVPVAAVFGTYYAGLGSTRTPSMELPRVAAEVPAPTADRVEPVAAAVSDATSDVELQIQSRGGCIVLATADGLAIPSRALQPGQPVVLKARGEVVLRVGDPGTCAPSVRADSVAKPPRQKPIGAVPLPSIAITHAVDQESQTTAPVVEPVPSASDVVLPQLPDEPAPPTVTEPF